MERLLVRRVDESAILSTSLISTIKISLHNQQYSEMTSSE